MVTPSPQGQYQFSNTWFDQNIPVWDQLLPRITPKKYLEIGAFEGRATCYMIEKWGNQNPMEIHCVDTWEGGIEHREVEAKGGKFKMSNVEIRFDSNVAYAAQNAKHPVALKKHKKLSHMALADLLVQGHSETFDLIYVDGSHEAPDVLTDAVMSYSLLKTGGFMIFDDYIWSKDPMGQQDAYKIPKPAVDAFMNIFQRKIQIIIGTPVYQLYTVKKGG